MLATRYSYDEASGQILSVMTGRLHGIASNHGGGLIVDLEIAKEIDDEKHYHKNGSLKDRPSISLPDTAVMGEAIVVPAIPVGSNIEVDKVVIGTGDGTDLELVFELDGDYEIKISPPFPYVVAATILTVTP